MQYAYDASDNRTRVVRGGVAETYSQGDPGDRLLWTNTGAATAPTPGQSPAYSTYVYDEWGQLIQRDRRATKLGAREVLNFLWDSAGRLREVKKAGATVFSARYAADGERVQKTDPASGSHVYSHGLHDTQGDTLYLPGVAERSGARTLTQHADRLGSARALTDGSGAGVSAQDYDAYGKVVAPGRELFQSRFQYAGAHGYEREPVGGPAELGLDYLYQRYYDPAMGRFISKDPIRWAGGLNLYGYVSNNPVNGVDPTGLQELFNYSPSDVQGAVRFFGTAARHPGTWGVTAAAGTLALGGGPALAVLSGAVFYGKVVFHNTRGNWTEAIGQGAEFGVHLGFAAELLPAGGIFSAAECGDGGGGGGEASFVVRRYLSSSRYKDARKNGISFDPSLGRGIPTTSAAHDPVNPDIIRRKTGAVSADFFIDFDVTGLPYFSRKTGQQWPEHVIQANLSPDRIVRHGPVPKSKLSR